MIMTSSHRRTGGYIIYGIYHSWVNIYHLRWYIFLNWWSPICQKVVERDYMVYTAGRHHAWPSSQTCNCQWHSSVVSLVFDESFPVSTLVLHLCPWCEHMTAHTVDFCVFFTMMGFSAASISSLESVASKMLLCFLLVWCWQSRPLHACLG